MSHYFDGLQIFDWSNPQDVKRVAWHDTSLGDDACCLGAWGVYPLLPSRRILVSDRQRGLFLFDLTPPSGEFELGLSPNPAQETVEVNLMDLGFDWNSAELCVYHADGRLVEQLTITNPGNYNHWIALNMAHWSAGLYVIEVIEGDRKALARLVKI